MKVILTLGVKKKMLKDKVVVITGGAGLIGKEFVKAVVENGGIAVIADINENLDVKDLGFRDDDLEKIDYVVMDITSKESLQKVISYINKNYNLLRKAA